MRKKARAWVGCTGFSHQHWKDGVFYPPGLSSRRWLEHYSCEFETVELGSTFFRLPEPETFDEYANRTPTGFKFSLKGSKLITHIRGLTDSGVILDQFMRRAMLLGDKLGAVVWQMPAEQKADLALLKRFIRELGSYRKVRHAFEFRHGSWLTDKMFAAVRDAGMSVADSDRPPLAGSVPVDFRFLYVHRHGPQGSYSDEALAKEAEGIAKAVKAGRDVFFYFGNDLGGHAPADARRLIELLAAATPPPKKPAKKPAAKSPKKPAKARAKKPVKKAAKAKAGKPKKVKPKKKTAKRAKKSK